MTYMDPDSEGSLEANAIDLFEELGWEAADCYRETFGTGSLLGRETSEQIVLERRLRAALLKLNPGISPLAIDLAAEGTDQGSKRSESCPSELGTLQALERRRKSFHAAGRRPRECGHRSSC